MSRQTSGREHRQPASSRRKAALFASRQRERDQRRRSGVSALLPLPQRGKGWADA